MNSDRLIKWTQDKYNRVLILLFLLLVSIALPEKQAIAKVTILILFLVAIAGVMYPTILISRLVNLYNTNSQEL